MAVGAHIVPGEIHSRPMQRIGRGELFIRVERKPAPAACFLWAAVPGKGRYLIAPAGKRNEILLQRIDPERIGNLVVVRFAVGAFGADDVFAVLVGKGGFKAEMRQAGTREIAEHGVLVRLLHRLVVMRATPELALGLVTADASLPADE